MSASVCLDSSHILRIGIDASNDTQYGSLTIPADLVHDAAGNRATNDVVLDYSMSGSEAVFSAVELNPRITLTPVQAETKTLPLAFHVEAQASAEATTPFTYSASCYEMNRVRCSAV